LVDIEKKQILQVGNIISFIGMLVVNLLANALPLNGKNTGEISDSYPNLFVPDGYVFSIWFLIYILLAIFSVYQAKDLFKSEKEDIPFIDNIGVFFIIANIGNILWIFFWHYELFLLPLIAIVILFLALLVIYLKLEIGVAEVPQNEKVFVHLPFSVYFGWLTVATVAQVTALLVELGAPSYGLVAELSTILVIIVVIVIGLLTVFTRNDIAYGLVLVWASIGIFTKQLPSNLLISIMGLIAAIIVAAGIIYKGYQLYIK
jgi:hypothetical protein